MTGKLKTHRHLSLLAVTTGLVLSYCSLSAWGQAPTAHATHDVDYARDIRPLLAAKCWKCHGGVKRESGLSLKFRDTATAPAASDRRAIVPGAAHQSELIRRISSADSDERMPPGNQPLDDDDIAVLARWIDQGAQFAPHWSFVAPARPDLPKVHDTAWPRRDMDRFVLARLEAEGLRPTRVAERATLVRRLHLDLIGLPPSWSTVAAFIDNPRPEAYEELVDDLLADEHFGERWASMWLDLARYADTKGYEKDPRRTIWRYRDWVIAAFNRDLPYDQFTMEQLAGDLLDEPTTDQLIATAFHRNTMTNTEGGTDDEEYRVQAVIDRVATTWQTWMGMTFGCAQCHDHPYEPFTQREYYRFFAFFNQTADTDQADESPTLPTPTVAQQVRFDQLTRSIRDLEQSLSAADDIVADGLAAWESSIRDRLVDPPQPTLGNWHVVGPFASASVTEAFLTPYEPQLELAEQGSLDLTAKYGDGGLAWTEQPEWTDGSPQVVLHGDNAATYLYRQIVADVAQPLTVSLGFDDTLSIWLNGDLLFAKQAFHLVESDQDRVTLPLRAGKNHLLMKVCNLGGDYGFYFQALPFDVPEEIAAIVRSVPQDRSAQQHEQLRRFYGTFAPETISTRARIATLRSELVDLQVPTTPVMQELPARAQRPTHVFLRGSFLRPGERVDPGVPAALHPLAFHPPDRLAMARWIVDPRNPLTARVAVNRFWERLFGRGLVATAEDFGLQGEKASHPQLLDWLATEFQGSWNWSVKRLLKEIVMSATYRQSSAITAPLATRDPSNHLLGRGARFRLEAELFRDRALSASGLLHPQLMGPSVMPWQPPGLWNMVYSGDDWKTSSGTDRYRRGLYTFWRRTSPYPSMMTMDAVSREVCAVRRVRTNTPLAALVALNDPVYVEAAQALARRMADHGNDDIAAAIRHGYRCALSRTPLPHEEQRLRALYEQSLARYADDHHIAAEMIGTSSADEVTESKSAQLASLTVVANVLMNLDEFIIRD